MIAEASPAADVQGKSLLSRGKGSKRGGKPECPLCVQGAARKPQGLQCSKTQSPETKVEMESGARACGIF